MPAVIPALEASGPSTTNTRLSITSRLGRQGPQRLEQLVVRRAATPGDQARARREQRPRADREHAMRRVLGEHGLAQALEPLRDRGDRPV